MTSTDPRCPECGIPTRPTGSGKNRFECLNCGAAFYLRIQIRAWKDSLHRKLEAAHKSSRKGKA